MSRYDHLSRLLLPLGMIVALGLGLLWPTPGQAAGELHLGPLNLMVAGVVLVFLISGVGIHGAVIAKHGYLRAVGNVLGVNLLLAPLLAAAALFLLPIEGGMAFGLAVTFAVPTTLSSAAVMTQTAGGDHAWAAGLTVICVVAGAFTAPIAVSALLRTDVSIPALPLLARVVIVVVIPLGLGYVVGRITGWKVNRWWRLAPSSAVLLLAWITLSQSSDLLRATPWPRLGATVVIVLVGHGLLIAAAWAVSRGLERRQALAVLFTASQKTLPLGLTLIAAVASLVPQLRPLAGEAVVVAVLWHFLQLLVDGSIAARMARSGTP